MSATTIRGGARCHAFQPGRMGRRPANPTRQRDALPALATVSGVQQDGGLAHDPALVTVEGDGVEAEVEALVLKEGQGREGSK